MAFRALRLARKVFRRIETKAKGGTDSGTDIHNGGIKYLLNGMPQGDDDGSRTGRQVYFTKAVIRFTLWGVNNSTIDEGYNWVRWWLVLDREPHETEFDYLDYQETNNDGNSLNTYNNRKRFVTLKSGRSLLSPVQQTYLYQINFSKARLVTKKLRFKTMYTGPGGTVSSIEKNALYMVFWADSGFSPHPTFTMTYRLYYQDA